MGSFTAASVIQSQVDIYQGIQTETVFGKLYKTNEAFVILVCGEHFRGQHLESENCRKFTKNVLRNCGNA